MPGTGKTIFGLQYLYKGAKNFDENGVYVSIEEDPRKLRMYGHEFGWKDIADLERQNKLDFLRVSPSQRKFDIVDLVKERVEKINAKRLVVDSLSAVYLAFEDISQFVYNFVNVLEELRLTSIFITDSPPGSENLTKDGVSEFVCDGVIQVQLHDSSKVINRTLAVKKMRGTLRFVSKNDVCESNKFDEKISIARGQLRKKEYDKALRSLEEAQDELKKALKKRVDVFSTCINCAC